MSEDRKSGTQQQITRRVAPDRAAAMEAESRTWMVRCPYCGFERSVWETGGVRYKAAGTARQLRRCPRCGRRSWHLVYRPQGPPGSRAALPLADPGRRPLLWALGLGGLLAVLVAFVAILFFGLSALTQPVVSRGDAFLSALQTGNYDAAYALCTPALQGQLGGAAGLAALARPAPLVRWNWTNRSVRNGTATLDGDLTYADGTAGPVHLGLQQVAGAWTIAAVRLPPR